MAKVDANWVNVEINTLDPTSMGNYEAYKNAYREMKAKREAFEASMADKAELPEGKRLVFGYNFGKLSVAVVEDDRKVAKPKQVTQSLSQFLASAKAHGDRM